MNLDVIEQTILQIIRGELSFGEKIISKTYCLCELVGVSAVRIEESNGLRGSTVTEKYQKLVNTFWVSDMETGQSKSELVAPYQTSDRETDSQNYQCIRIVSHA